MERVWKWPKTERRVAKWAQITNAALCCIWIELARSHRRKESDTDTPPTGVSLERCTLLQRRSVSSSSLWSAAVSRLKSWLNRDRSWVIAVAVRGAIQQKNLTKSGWFMYRAPKVGFGWEKFVSAIAYLFCLALPESCLTRFTNLFLTFVFMPPSFLRFSLM